jgi:hypothetical protein
LDTQQPISSEVLYRAAVGEAKASYYVPRFLGFDAPGASKISWNWPAFFVTFFWLLYRRMYGLAFTYFLGLPILLAAFGGVVMLLFGKTGGAIVYCIAALAVHLTIPMYANAIYHRHIRRRIVELETTAPSQEALVERLIGQSSVSGAVAIIGVSCFVGVAMLGILAAIAIPAYQDYTIRAQVVEGLNLATAVKASVENSYRASST